MTDPINLERLRSITGGDPTLEKRLFTLFLSTIDHCIRKFSEAMAQNSAEQWKNAAHELKGAAANVGAEELRSLSQFMEQLSADDANARRASIDSIHAESTRIKNYWATLSS